MDQVLYYMFLFGLYFNDEVKVLIRKKYIQYFNKAIVSIVIFLTNQNEDSLINNPSLQVVLKN